MERLVAVVREVWHGRAQQLSGVYYHPEMLEARVNQTIRAIYEDGVLRPLTPLEIPDRTEVQIRVEAAPERTDAQTHRRHVDAALVAGGLLLPRLNSAPSHSPLTNAARDALARHIPSGRPLSEIILEERDGR